MPANSIRSLHRSVGKRFGRAAPEWLIDKYRHWTTDVYVVSFPKSGRTWFRTILGTTLQLKFGTSPNDPTSVHHMWMFDNKVPRFVFTHDINAHLNHESQVKWDGQRYRDKKTIFLMRDPRDTIVSLYFEMSKRVGSYNGSISEFIREERGGIGSLVTFLNEWMRNIDKLEHKLVLSYEDLHSVPLETMSKTLEFTGVKDVDLMTIAQAVDLCSFDQMQKMERSGVVEHVRLRPGNVDDPSSFKVRSGKVGGYKSQLSPEDSFYLDNYVADHLDERFEEYRRS